MAKPLAVDDFAQNVESGWIGRIVAIYNERYQIDSGGKEFDCWMAKMIDVDRLVHTVTGLPLEECLTPDDVQFHAIDDLRTMME